MNDKTPIIRCAVQTCTRDHYRNEMVEVLPNIYICPACAKVLLRALADKQILTGMVRSTMSLQELDRINEERRQDYALSSINRSMARMVEAWEC